MKMDTDAVILADESTTAFHRCWICDKEYQNSGNMYRHMRLKHHASEIKVQLRSTFKCALCKEESLSRKKFDEHFPLRHGISLETETLTFADEAEFLAWKGNEEKLNCCLFVKRTGSKKSNGKIVTYFYCHRSANFVSRNQGQTKIKVVGSKKISGLCPSRIKLVVSEDSASVEVTYYKTHVEHLSEPARLKFTSKKMRDAHVIELEPSDELTDSHETKLEPSDKLPDAHETEWEPSYELPDAHGTEAESSNELPDARVTEWEHGDELPDSHETQLEPNDELPDAHETEWEPGYELPDSHVMESDSSNELPDARVTEWEHSDELVDTHAAQSLTSNELLLTQNMEDANATTSADENITAFHHRCWVCDKTYQKASNMYRHMRLKHGASEIKVQAKSTFKCALCEEESPSRKKFDEHFPLRHGISLETETLTFADEAEFLAWKGNEEKLNCCLFAKRTGSKKSDGKILTYFYCRRSENFVSQSQGQRKIKALGSNKISGLCPSTIKCVVSEDSGSVQVRYCKAHVGHKNEPKRLIFTGKKTRKARVVTQSEPGDELQDIVRILETEPSNELVDTHITKSGPSDDYVSIDCILTTTVDPLSKQPRVFLIYDE